MQPRAKALALRDVLFDRITIDYRSVAGRSPFVAAMRRLFESAPRHVGHQAVRSGRASGRPRRREAQLIALLTLARLDVLAIGAGTSA
jgi:hypothetical protein